jgi:hypothetical protein
MEDLLELLLDEDGFVVLEDFDFTKMDEKTAAWLRGFQNTLSAVKRWKTANRSSTSTGVPNSEHWL